MAKPRGTTATAARAFKEYSKQGSASNSTKTPKPATRRVFGSSSQFKGVGVGVPGDVRK
jgi:hypothetical protein